MQTKCFDAQYSLKKCSTLPTSLKIRPRVPILLSASLKAGLTVGEGSLITQKHLLAAHRAECAARPCLTRLQRILVLLRSCAHTTYRRRSPERGHVRPGLFDSPSKLLGAHNENSPSPAAILFSWNGVRETLQGTRALYETLHPPLSRGDAIFSPLRLQNARRRHMAPSCTCSLSINPRVGLVLTGCRSSGPKSFVSFQGPMNANRSYVSNTAGQRCFGSAAARLRCCVSANIVKEKLCQSADASLLEDHACPFLGDMSSSLNSGELGTHPLHHAFLPRLP